MKECFGKEEEDPEKTFNGVGILFGVMRGVMRGVMVGEESKETADFITRLGPSMSCSSCSPSFLTFAPFSTRDEPSSLAKT